MAKIKWYKGLYVSPKLQKRKKSCIYRIERKRFLRGIYLILLSAHPDNQLEIMDARYLKLPFKDPHIPMVVGLADSYGAALSLLLDILDDAGKAGMKGQAKKYILRQEGICKV